MKTKLNLSLLAGLLIAGSFVCSISGLRAEDPWVVFEGKEGIGKGKHIVLLSGDEEYRSEEALPMLGKVLARHHGFKCTVLFSINPEDGTIDPNNQVNIPGLHHLDSADLVIMAWRFRRPNDEGMKHIDAFLKAGKPIIGLRTSTHAFNFGGRDESSYKHYSFNSGEWKGGFGQQVLGDTWISHHGGHKREATRGLVNWEQRKNPILRGVKDVFGDTDVYGVRNLGDDADILLWGQVLEGMSPDDKGVNGPKNNPMMPIAWTRLHQNENGRTNRVLCTTMGSSTDFASEDLRRLVVNGVYWGLGLEGKIPEKANVSIVGEYKPSKYGFVKKFENRIKPSAHLKGWE